MGSSTGQVDQVLGIDGGVLTAADLPPRNLKRWIARRKAEIVAAVEGGLLRESEACARYNISREEFSAWLNAYDRDGVPDCAPGRKPAACSGGMRLTSTPRRNSCPLLD